MFKTTLCVVRRQPKWSLNQFKARDFTLPKMHLVTQQNASPVKLIKPQNTFDLDCRKYSKSRDKKKDKKKSVKFDEMELKEYFDVDKLLSEINKPVELFKEDLSQYATLKSSVGAIESVKIQVDGSMFTIQDLARIGKKNPRLYVLDFSSFPEAIPNVLSSLQKLDMNTQQDGTKVIVPVPKLSKEHREVLVKKCKLYFQKCKERIRDVQMKHIKSLGKIEKLSLDEKFRLTDQLTALGNKQILLAEELMKERQEELSKVDESLV